MRRLTLSGFLALVLVLVSFSATASPRNVSGRDSADSRHRSNPTASGLSDTEPLPPECIIDPNSCYTQTQSSGFTIQNTPVGNKVSDYIWSYGEGVNYSVCSSTTCSHLGQVYVTARINMNGRQSKWGMSIAPMSGPYQIKGTNKWNCRDNNGSLPDTSCSGGQQARTASDFHTNAFHSSDTNYHSDDEVYWYNFSYAWKAINYPSWTFSWVNKRSWKFACNQNYAGAAKCRFNQ